MVTKVVVISMLAAASIHANVIYTFVGTGESGPEPVAFQLTVPDFVHPPNSGSFVEFTCAQLDSSTNCDPSGIETFSYQSVMEGFSAQLTFEATNDTEYGFFFPTGAFGTPGVYSAETGLNFNSGTLTVTQTPEPHTILLILIGFFVLVCRRRRVTLANPAGT